MRVRYDLSRLSWKPNPYAKRLKRPVTMRLDVDVVAYFKKLGLETGIPYQRLINLYLRDCAATSRRPSIRWGDAS